MLQRLSWGWQVQARLLPSFEMVGLLGGVLHRGQGPGRGICASHRIRTPGKGSRLLLRTRRYCLHCALSLLHGTTDLQLILSPGRSSGPSLSLPSRDSSFQTWMPLSCLSVVHFVNVKHQQWWSAHWSSASRARAKMLTPEQAWGSPTVSIGLTGTWGDP